MIESFVWNINPEIFSLDILGHTFAPRWYGICFATGLLLGYLIMKKFFDKAGYSEEVLNSGFVMVAIGTVVGARLGHCLFYEPELYLARPWKILYVWEGGLASHGGTIGVVIACAYYCRKFKIPFVWLFDRMAVACPLGAAFIRLGNFFNSEIVGVATEGPFGVVFARVDQVARHPAQLYESLIYFAIFLILYVGYKIKGEFKPGRPIGFMFAAIFGARILVEFIKVEQVDFEKGMVLNMGQILSIPLVLVGLFFLFGGYDLLAKNFSLQKGLSTGTTSQPTMSAEESRQQRKNRRKMQKKLAKK